MAMNKKAAGKEILYFMATIFIILILIVFFFLSKFFSPKAPDIVSEFSINEQNVISLISFLKTTVDVESQNITMADLIRLSQMDSKYQTIIKEEAGNLFDPLYGKNVHFMLSSAEPRFYFDVLTTPYFIGEKNILNMTLPSYPNLGAWFGIGEKWGQEK
jgi:hypothetical protein